MNERRERGRSSTDLAATFADAKLQKTILSWPLHERLCWLMQQFGDGLAMTSAFGYSGMIVMHHLKDINPAIPVYFLDTRFHFPETLAFVEQVKQSWGLNIHMIESTLTNQEIEDEIGKRAYASNPDACCKLRKVEPLLSILPSHKAWIHALRRDQSTSREHLNLFEVDKWGVYKMYPLLDWTRDQCWAYIRKHDVLVHPLHAQGYPSIGCVHCTAKVTPGLPERAGRWNSFPEKIECGLHCSQGE